MVLETAQCFLLTAAFWIYTSSAGKGVSLHAHLCAVQQDIFSKKRNPSQDEQALQLQGDTWLLWLKAIYFSSLLIFLKLLFLWHWHPVCSVPWGFGVFFLSFTSIKKQSSGSCLLCLFYFITWPALITIESRWGGRMNSSCLLGFRDFVSSVLLPLDPGMF